MADPSPSGEGGGATRRRVGFATTKQTAVARSLRKRLTPQEVKLWVRLRALRPIGLHFRRQVPIGAYVVDFACLRQALIVEVDGGQHGNAPNVFRDAMRDAALRGFGYRVLRIWNSDVDRNLNGVVEIIASAIAPHPARKSAPPSPKGGGIGAAALDPSLPAADPFPVVAGEASIHPSPSGEGGGAKRRRVGRPDP